jgi:hypothetical protein
MIIDVTQNVLEYQCYKKNNQKIMLNPSTEPFKKS